MVNYNFINSEEELLHVIRTRTATYEDYMSVVEKVQNINYTDCNDVGFLHDAIREKKIDVALDLIHRGIDVDLQTVNGYTAAQMAVSGEHWEIVEEILKCHPKINLKDWRYGESLLHDIVRYNSEVRNQMAKRLIEMGANPYAENNNGASPLDLVIANQNEELIKAFQQIPKPLQKETEKYRVPKKSAGFFNVKIRDYKKFICTEDTTIEYLQEKILDYATIAGGKKKKYKFKLVPIEESRWIIICCPDKMDFYNYHNLMSWIWGIPDDIKTPSQTICAAVHENDERLSYYAVMDKSKYGDARMVGRFQNGESFSIYLPEAYKKDGNARSYSDVLPIKRIDEYLDACGMDETWLEKTTDRSGVEIEVEMAV